ncbi:DUF58 domain-containing protein [Oerskovia flava]|uniref:DUF58 domain-containing protein n=1 Tax=Oerskovia flava TaxID=2986422 RepID=UPI0022401B21|nr:DUF58 domain-containing protein [Oerskovia sp. JB1-3-2]
MRPTARGAGAALAGLVLVAVGITLGLPDVVGLGAAPLLAVGVVWAWMSVRRIDRGRGALHVVRRVDPNPAVRGQVTTARLSVSARVPSVTAYGRLSRLRISEQAANELCDQGALHAQLVIQGERIAVRYRLQPGQRGRWPLGPLLTSRVDVFGLVRATQTLGVPTPVAVWPRTVELPVRGSRAFGAFDRSAAGAQIASDDDSVLREYVLGDDPRRVHWATAARRGQLMVRADESAGVPPVTVFLDRGSLPATTGGPANDDGTTRARGEWAVECAASVALSLLRAGHPTRLVTSSSAPVVEAVAYSVSRSSEGVARILDDTLDLRGHRGPGEADKAVAATADALRRARRSGEITIAVLGPLRPVARHAVAAMAGDGLHWAVVQSPPPGTPGHQEATETADVLRSTGWHVVMADDRTSIEHAWSRLAEGAR